MAGEDQERLEDYLALERYIEALQAGRIAPLPRVETIIDEGSNIFVRVPAQAASIHF